METEVPLETEEILRKLGDNFGLDDGVVEALLRLGVENLQEFRFLWASEQAIETWIGKLGLGDECLADDSSGAQSMGSRRAVLPPGRTRSLQDCTVRSGHDARGDRASRHQATVLEALQDEVPPEIHPTDTTISRVAREMQKRMLCVYNIWRVKTLQFQLTTSQKKRKLSDGLFIEEGEDEEVVAHDVDNYLDRLFTLLLAYAMSGCAGVTGAPDAAQELNLGADTAKFVNVPLDVIYKYYFRAKRSITVMPIAQRLHWLQTRDV